MQLNQITPDLYQNILSQQVLKIDVTETKATCDNCLRSRDRRFKSLYQSHLKCCTFHPYLPNYAVGALLNSSEKTVGIQRIEDKILNSAFNLPIGLIAPFDYQFQFLNKEETDFGQREDLLCPYYDRMKNQCSIWKYRGVVCTTFYCRSDHGQDGLKFWAVLSDYLSYVEMALAEECLVMLDFSPRDLSNQLMYLNKYEFDASEVNQKTISSKDLKTLWNGYSDYFDFYKKCDQIVKNLDRKKFKEILGHQGLALEKEVMEYANRRKN